MTLDKFLTRARAGVSVYRRMHLTVCLVTDAEIARWNRAYRGKNRPTDVLSFPTNGFEPNAGGDKADASSKICLTSSNCERLHRNISATSPSHRPVAKRNASRFGRSFDDEMRILILHGILHLMGYDHEADKVKWTAAKSDSAASWGWFSRWPLILYTIGVLALTAGLALFAYLDRVYRELGRESSPAESSAHLETFEADIEPRFKMDRHRAALAFYASSAAVARSRGSRHRPRRDFLCTRLVGSGAGNGLFPFRRSDHADAISSVAFARGCAWQLDRAVCSRHACIHVDHLASASRS